MVRPRKKRLIDFSPLATYFKPAGVPLRELENVNLAYEELEALRLQVLLNKSQGEAAREMNISQPTFHRLINSARKKIVDALVNSKAIKIEGGVYEMKEENIQDAVVAISSSSANLDGDVDDRFGRCQYFVLVFLEGGEIKSFKIIENTKAGMRGGVGTVVAQMIADNGVSSVITGNIGPRALDVFKQFDISVYCAKRSKRQAIQDFIDGKSERLQ